MSARLTCWASSRVGTTMMARGWQGRLFSPARRASTGMPNARVLPEPVWARPSTSWPASPSGMTAAWTGVGAVMPWAARAVISSAGRVAKIVGSVGRSSAGADMGCFRSGWVRPARSHTGADPASLARRCLVTRSTGLVRRKPHTNTGLQRRAAPRRDAAATGCSPSLRAGFAFARIVVAVRWATPPRHADPSLVDAPGRPTRRSLTRQGPTRRYAVPPSGSTRRTSPPALDPDRHAPVLLVHPAGRALAAVDVAGRRPRGHVQHALADLRVQLQRAGEVGAAAVAGADERRRRRLDDQLRGRAEAVVDLLSRRWLEGDHQLQRRPPRRSPGAACGARTRRCGRPAAPSGSRVSRCAPGLDDDQQVALDVRPARLGQVRRQRGDLAARRVEAPDRAVVGVADRERCRRAARSRRAGAGAAPARPRRRGSRSRTVRCRPRCRPPARRARRRASAGTRSRCRRARAGRRRAPARRSARTTPRRPARRRSPSLVVPAATSTVAGARVEGPQLVDAGHRDPDPVLPPGDVPGLESRSAPSPCIHWAPSPASTRTSPVARVMPAQLVVDGVGDHDVVPHLGGDVGRQQAQAVGLAEPPEAAHARRPPRPARRPRRARRPRPARRRRAAAPPWPGSAGRWARPAAATYGESPGCSVPLRPVLLDQLAEQRVDRVHVALAGVLRDDVALRVDEHQRRPGPGGVGLPGDQLGVVEDGVVHGVALDRLRQRHRVGLVHELRRVHADHDQLVGEPLLQRPQLVDDVQAVDAAEGPEVEQHEAAAQVAQRDVARRCSARPGRAARGPGRGAGAHRAILPRPIRPSSRPGLTRQDGRCGGVAGPGQPGRCGGQLTRAEPPVTRTIALRP